MRNLKIIKLTIMVDENSPWRNIGHFNQSFEDYCTSFGMEVDQIDVMGNPGEQVIYVSKIQDMPAIHSKPMTFKTPTPVKGK